MVKKWKGVLFLLVVLALPVILVVSTGAQDHDQLARAQDLAVRGGQAYESGDYSRALDFYREAIGLGLDHPTLHYNLGNAWYKSGHLGKAIASYLRASRVNPRDHAVQANLRRAQSQIQDEALAPLALPFFLKPLGWIHRQLSLNEWAGAGLILIWLLCLMSIASHWKLFPIKWKRKAAPLLVVLALIVMLMAVQHYRLEEGRRTAVIISPEVEVRSGPGDDYNLAFKIHEGLQVYMAESREEWVQIHLGGELVGWVHAGDLEEL